MENSSLNVSHRYARQANKFFRNAKFDEAIYHHELAQGKIDEALNSVCQQWPKVQESLRLQKQFHTKQIDLIIIRREQHEKCIAAQAAVDKGIIFRNNLEDSRQVQIELYKSLDNVEKVVEVLEQKTLSTGTKEATEFLSKLFEDLKLMNQQSMLMVNRLVTQLEDRITENEDLREMVQENDAFKASQPRTSSLDKKKSRDLSDSDPELNKLEELAPLELPTFDFNTFSASPATSASEEGSSTKEEATGALRRIGLAGDVEEEGEECVG